MEKVTIASAVKVLPAYVRATEIESEACVIDDGAVYIAVVEPFPEMVPMLADQIRDAPSGSWVISALSPPNAESWTWVVASATVSKFWGWISIRVMQGSMLGTLMLSPFPGLMGMLALSGLNFAEALMLTTLGSQPWAVVRWTLKDSSAFWKVETLQVTVAPEELQPLGRSTNEEPLGKEMSMPGSLSKSLRSTLTDHDAACWEGLKAGFERVMSGQLNCRWVRIRLELEGVIF